MYDYEDIDIGAVELAAVRLHSRKVFHGRSSDYREAMEGLIQYLLVEAISFEGLRFGVISRVMLNGYTRLPYITREAEFVAARLLGWLKELFNSITDMS